VREEYRVGPLRDGQLIAGYAAIAMYDAGRQPQEVIARALAGFFHAALGELPRGALNVKTRRTKRKHDFCRFKG
jgi:hypothetical protein